MKLQAFLQPFRHWILDGFVPADRLAAALRDVPPRNWPHWVRYHTEWESHKRTCNQLDLLPPAVANLLRALNSPRLACQLDRRLGLYAGLTPDPLLWGAGLHVLDAPGRLQSHLDYARHQSGLERRLNLLLFLNPSWREEWGGSFELFDANGSHCVKRLWPQYGRAVVWEAGDLSYHGTQQLDAQALPRITLAAYYLAPPRPGCVRQRALFVPPR